jgi:hypothetical protein
MAKAGQMVAVFHMAVSVDLRAFYARDVGTLGDHGKVVWFR